jgi:hypothetical protein
VVQPSGGPFIEIEVDGDDVLLLWKNKETLGPAIRLKNVGSTAAEPLVRLESGNAKVQLELAVGSSVFSFKVEGSKLVISTGGEAMLELQTSRPAVAGSRGGNAALANLLTKLAVLKLIDDDSSA